MREGVAHFDLERDVVPAEGQDNARTNRPAVFFDRLTDFRRMRQPSMERGHRFNLIENLREILSQGLGTFIISAAALYS